MQRQADGARFNLDYDCLRFADGVKVDLPPCSHPLALSRSHYDRWGICACERKRRVVRAA